MNYRDLDFNLLLILDCLFDAGSTTVAAERLKISQPTVSFSLGKLRAVFGDELFVRHGLSIPLLPNVHFPLAHRILVSWSFCHCCYRNSVLPRQNPISARSA
jgi:DNA-binding transcriptional LysR family regulator